MSGLAVVLYIPTFYATEVGLSLATVGLVFSLGRVVDVVSDPIIGHLSDQTRSRFGPRIPWIIVGVPCFAAAVWMLLVPPENAGVTYLAFACLLYFFFITVLNIPYSSIGLEISPDVHERSLLAGSKAIFQVIGAITAATLPVLFALSMGNGLIAIAAGTAVLCAVSLILFLTFVPRQRHIERPEPRRIWQTVPQIMRHRPFRFLILAFFIVQAANALTIGLMAFYVTHVLKAPQFFNLFVLILFLSTAIFIPVWIILSKRTSKKISWICSILFCSCVLFGGFFLATGSFVGGIIFFALVGAVFGCDAIMPTSMLADIVHEEEKSGSQLAGLFLAFKDAVSKLAFTVPVAIAFPVLEWVGFEPEGTNGESQLMVLALFFAAVPIALRLVAAVLLSRVTIHQPAPFFGKMTDANAETA